MKVATLEPSTAGATKRSMGEWLHVTILTAREWFHYVGLTRDVANGVVMTYVRIIFETVITESVCSLIKSKLV